MQKKNLLPPMAKTEKRNRERTAISSYFLGCFGISRKTYSDKDGGEKKMNNKNEKGSVNRGLSSSKFRVNNREIKPAPINETEKVTWSVEDETDKQKPVPVIRRLTDRNNILVDDKAMDQETKETKPNDLQDMTTDRSKPVEQLVSSKEDTCPERISNSIRYVKPAMKSSRVKNGSRVEKFDPFIGISVIVLTLVIMLVCGRLCAILCTSAWCYFLPRLREAAALAKRKRDGRDLKLDSCKKKVVLDGFVIGRKNRVSFL